MTDEHKRYLAMRNILRGNYTQKDIKALANAEISRHEEYGNEEILLKDEIRGSRMNLDYRGETRNYFYTSEGIWLRGRDILVEKVYRIFDEDDKTIQVRKVQEPSEIEAIVQGCRQEIKRLLGKSHEKCF